MSKTAVTRLFIGAGLAIIAGAVLTIIAGAIAIASDTFVLSGPDIVGVRASGAAWFSLALGVVGIVAFIGGVIAGLVSWIGALFNTWQLDSKAWFVGLLLLGIFNLGFFAMVAYILAGPDGLPAKARQVGAAPVPA
jgi:hypothetical protein